MRSTLKWFKSLYLYSAISLFLLHLVRRIFKIRVNFSYSQFGEDINLKALLGGSTETRKGFYVDVGCNHPIRVSNTFNLYLDGWAGIAIDANKDLIAEFKKIRKNDIAICSPVSDNVREIVFYKSKVDSVSTIDEKTYLEWKELWKYDEADFEKVTTRTLTSILDEAMPAEVKKIDLLCVDVEGHDYEVLLGLDFNKYKPGVIIVEIFTKTLKDVFETDIYKYLNGFGYDLIWYSIHNAYFKINL